MRKLALLALSLVTLSGFAQTIITVRFGDLKANMPVVTNVSGVASIDYINAKTDELQDEINSITTNLNIVLSPVYDSTNIVGYVVGSQTNKAVASLSYANRIYNDISEGGYVKTNHIGNVEITGDLNVLYGKVWLPLYVIEGLHLAGGPDPIGDGIAVHVEGAFTSATGNYSHSEGYLSSSSGESSHSEGYITSASGYSSHSEGYETEASSAAAHSEGFHTKASGASAHAEGRETIANGANSHAEGIRTHAYAGSHVSGVRAVSTNYTAFVWSGHSGRPYTEYDPTNTPAYLSHGDGTFNINPVGGASGVWIGEQTLEDIAGGSTGGNVTNTIVSGGYTITNEVSFSDEDGNRLTIWRKSGFGREIYATDVLTYRSEDNSLSFKNTDLWLDSWDMLYGGLQSLPDYIDEKMSGVVRSKSPNIWVEAVTNGTGTSFRLVEITE